MRPVQGGEEIILAGQIPDDPFQRRHRGFGRSGRHILNHAGGGGFYRCRPDRQKGLPARFFRRQHRHRSGPERIHHIGGHRLDPVGGGNSHILARPGIGHAVGIAPERIIQAHAIFMLADSLLAAILGEGVFGIEIAPVAVAADQARGIAVGADGQPNASLAEIGVAGVIVEPGNARHVQFGHLLGLHQPVADRGLQPGVLLAPGEAIGKVGRDIAARVLDDLVGRIADLQHRIAVVQRILVAGDADHHGVEPLLHLVVGAQVQGGIAIAAPGCIAAPGAIQRIVDAFLAVGTGEVRRLDLAVEIEAVADPPRHLGLAGILGGKGIDIGFDPLAPAAIGHRAVPNVKARQDRRLDLLQSRRAGNLVDLLRAAPGLRLQRLVDQLVIGEMHRAAMGAIRARLNLARPLEAGAAAVAEGIFIRAHHIAPHPGRGGRGLDKKGRCRNR